MSDLPDITDADIDATLDADTLERLRCMAPLEQQNLRDAIRRDMCLDGVMADLHQCGTEGDIARLREKVDLVLWMLRQLHEAHHELKAEVEGLKRGGAA